MSQRGSSGLGLDWNFDLQEGFINNRGETVIHEIGLRCACNKEDIHAGMIEKGPHVLRKRSRFGCDVCGGEGFIYRSARAVIALIGGFTESKSQLEAGWAYPGDVTMSVKPGYVVSAFDRITFTWPEVVDDGQTLIRGAAQLNDNAGRKLNLEENEDLLYYHAIDGIYCEDIDGTVYKEGDYELDGSRIIRWIGKRPTLGKAYTIKYAAYTEWIVFMPPAKRRDRDRDLGSRIGLRKRHVALINENPTVKVTDRVTFCDRLSSLTSC